MTHSPYDPHHSPGPSSGQEGRPEWGRPGTAHLADQGLPDGPGNPGQQGQQGQPGHTPPPGQPAPGTDLASDLGAGLRFALDAMLRNPITFIVPGVIYGLLALILLGGAMVLGFVLAFPQMEAATQSDDAPLGVLLTVYGITALGMLLAMPMMWFWQTGAVRAGSEVVAGRRPSFGQAMIGTGRLLLTLLLVGVIVLVGMLLLYIPGIIASVALIFALPAAARGASPVEALKESLSLVKNNLGTSIVTVLVGAAIGSIGGMLVITVVVLIPFQMLFHLAIYERLSGRRLVDPVRA